MIHKRSKKLTFGAFLALALVPAFQTIPPTRTNNQFPFVAKPNQPSPPGSSPDDHTRQ